MTKRKILAIVRMYQGRFEREDIPKARMPEDEFFSENPEIARGQMLAHAHFLLDGIREYAIDPEKKGKTGRHLASAQMMLWAAGWYTLEEIMNHNRPDAS